MAEQKGWRKSIHERAVKWAEWRQMTPEQKAKLAEKKKAEKAARKEKKWEEKLKNKIMGKPVSSSSSGEEEEEESEDDMKEKEVPLDKVLKKVEKVNGPMQPIKEVDEAHTPTLNKTKILDETKDGLLN